MPLFTLPRLTGKPVSQTTGLYYNYQRWYDPSIGRFIDEDSVEGALSDPQSLNPYVYVSNRPTTLTDPAGLTAIACYTCPAAYNNPLGLPPILAQFGFVDDPYSAAVLLGAYGLYEGGTLLIGALTTTPTRTTTTTTRTTTTTTGGPMTVTTDPKTSTGVVSPSPSTVGPLTIDPVAPGTTFTDSQHGFIDLKRVREESFPRARIGPSFQKALS